MEVEFGKNPFDDNIEEMIYCYERLYHMIKVLMKSGKKRFALKVLRDIKRYDKQIDKKKDMFLLKNNYYL